MHTSQTFFCFFFIIDISHSAGSLNGIQYAPHNSQRRHLSRLHQLPENKHVTRFHLDVNSPRQRHFSPKREARRVFLEGTKTCPCMADSPLIVEASRDTRETTLSAFTKNGINFLRYLQNLICKSREQRDKLYLSALYSDVLRYFDSIKYSSHPSDTDCATVTA